MRLMVLGVVALLAPGCCCPGAPSTARAHAPAPERQFIVLRATAMAADAEGRLPFLVESTTVSVPRTGVIQALNRAKRLDAGEVPVWLAGTQVPDAADFREGARVLGMPSLVVLDGEEGVVEVGEQAPEGGFQGMTLRVAPTTQASGLLAIRFSYVGTAHGGMAFSVPGTVLEGPAGRVFIVQAVEGRARR